MAAFMAQQPPPQYSSDGRWLWDGQRWVPVQPQPQAPAPSANRDLLLIGGGIALVLVLGVCGMGVCALALNGGGSNPAGSGPSGDIIGTYALKQINGQDLPTGGSFGHVVVDGTLELKSDGTYSIRFSWFGETGAARYTGDDGPYTRSGNKLTFSPNDETYEYTGQLGSDSVLVTYDWSRNGKTDRFLFRR